MHAASRQALASLRERLDSVTPRFSTADGLTGLAQELYQVVDLLVTQPQLRRKLADPTTEAQRRSDLIGLLLENQLSPSAVQLVRDAVALRWSGPWDMLDALEITADDVLFAAAELAGVLDTVEDELFRFERVLDVEPGLTTILDEPSADVARRTGLLRNVLGNKVHPITAALLEHAVGSERRRNLTTAIDDLLEHAAARRERSMARVLSAVELTGQQQARLTAALTELYGRPINTRTAIDPTVRGGLVIKVGDEIIDGSVAARLVSARTALAG